MKILIAYHSRTGYTAELALLIAEALVSSGHTVDFEKIEPVAREKRWPILWRTMWYWGGAFGLGTLSNKYRQYFIENYKIPEVDIKPLVHPDVSEYDRICIGSPKQTIIPCPIERYLRQVEGLKGKKVGYFATWGGPPLKHFEVESLFRPAADRLERRGAKLVSILGLTSLYHEYSLTLFFRFFSRLRFGLPIEAYSVHSAYGKKNRKLFCQELIAGELDVKESKGWNRAFEGPGVLGVASASGLTTLRFVRRFYNRWLADKESR
jgi:flavodoxin